MSNRCILVVDDEPTILEVIAEILEDVGYNVVTATNGAEALDTLDSSAPELVLLDMRMPILDGWGFVRALRQQGRECRIVVMTAAQDAHRWANEIGAVGCVPKPFELHELLTAIDHVWGSAA